MTQLGDRFTITDTRRSSRNDDRAQSFLPALFRVGADDAHVHVRAHQVPSSCVARPILLAVQHILSPRLVMRRDKSDTCLTRAGMIEVRRPPGLIDRLAHGPSGDVLAARIARCLYEPLFL